MKAEMGYCTTSFGRIHYRMLGEGDPLLLLHRSPRSSRDWFRLMPILAERYQVIAMDTLGFGQSDPLPEGVTMELLAESVDSFLTTLNIQRANVFGIHTGNKIAAALACQFPDRVDRVILCGMIHSIIDDRSQRNAAIKDIVDLYFMPDQGTEDGSHLLRRWAVAFSELSRSWWNTPTLLKGKITENDLEHFRLEALDSLQAYPSKRAIYQANFDYDFGAALRGIVAPTLIMELCVPEEEHLGRNGQHLLEIMQNAQLSVMEDADGDVVIFRAEEVAGLINAFLEG